MPDQPIQTGGLLFEWVQTLRVWEDSKTFPDSLPLAYPPQIEDEFRAFLDEYAAAHPDLPAGCMDSPLAFVQAVPDEARQGSLTSQLRQWVLKKFLVQPHSIEQHIEVMWSVLERRSDDLPANSTLIKLPKPYIVAGGRYVESYYWDSYFTSLGLMISGRATMLRGMVENFASLIERYGYVPNGTRTYYLGRSQPPYFSHFLDLLDLLPAQDGPDYYNELKLEYSFWMDDSTLESPSLNTNRRRVEVDQVWLSRYWDDNTTPRPEGFWEDVQTASAALVGVEGAKKLYRHLRAAAESGWDFSSRWIAPKTSHDGTSVRYALSDIRTTEMLPVDLNAMIYKMEMRLARMAEKHGEPQAAAQYTARAAARKEAIMRLFWNPQKGWFFDYHMPSRQQSQVWSLAGVHPLFCKLFDPQNPEEARCIHQVHHNLMDRFLKPGGVVSSLVQSGQQWDQPNGWAPLQWVAMMSLLNYGYMRDASEIATRFVDLVRQTYATTGKMMEKYDVCDLSRPGGGGEYPNQEGFGWTNGVTLGFIDLLAAREHSLAARMAAALNQ